MKQYITVVKDVLSPTFCSSLIDKFERNANHEQEETVWDNRHFIEVNITKHWDKEHEIFYNTVQSMWRLYVQEHTILLGSVWPKTFGFEQFRMKRYLPNGRDQFSFHTDVGSYNSSRRFLSFLFYLNTVQDGGKTVFAYAPDDDSKVVMSIPAVQGQVLMFPPLWTHPHWGEKVVSGPKWIVSSYLHYL